MRSQILSGLTPGSSKKVATTTPAHECNPELEPLATAELRDAWFVGGCPGCCHRLGMFIKDSGSSSLTYRA